MNLKDLKDFARQSNWLKEVFKLFFWNIISVNGIMMINRKAIWGLFLLFTEICETISPYNRKHNILLDTYAMSAIN